MDFMTWSNFFGISGGLLAAASGAVGYGMTLIAQAAPQIPSLPANLDSLTTAIGTGSVLTGSAGILLAASSLASNLLKPYWEDRQKQRDSEERKLRIQTSLRRNNWITRKHQEWIIEAHKCNPQLPVPPDWVSLQDTGEFEGDTK